MELATPGGGQLPMALPAVDGGDAPNPPSGGKKPEGAAEGGRVQGDVVPQASLPDPALRGQAPQQRKLRGPQAAPPELGIV